MLYDKKWDVKADPLSLESFIGFLEKQPRRKAYDWSEMKTCAMGQWLSTMDPGTTYDPAGSPYELYRYRVSGSCVNLEPFKDVVRPRPHTFGAALTRARNLRAVQS